jgi:signal transduction histidine kinase
MRSIQRALLLLALYLLVVAALAWWANEVLDSTAHAVMNDTAHLVASEVAAALDEQVVTELVQGSPVNRRRLLHQIFDITRRSSMVRSLAVVDARGDVFASDDFVAVGRHLLTPRQVFAASPQPRLIAEGEGRAGADDYVLLVPLQRQDALVGYLRIGLDPTHLRDLFSALRHRLFFGALGGLLLVAALSYILHVRLRQRNADLVAALERAAAGDAGEASGPQEFLPALAVAGRIGRELQQERQRNLQADRRLQRLADMMDVGLIALAGDGQVELASERARSLLGLPAEPTAEQWRGALGPLDLFLQNASSGQPRNADRASGSTTDLEVTRQGRVGSVRCQVYPRDEEGTAGYLVQLRDRDLLLAIETDLRMAAQLRALTRVYRGVAHDLRAPLNAMVLNLELLRRSLDPAAPPREDMAGKQQRWVGVIEQEIQRLRRALDVLLAQTAPTSEKTEPFDLRGVLEEIEALLFPQARQQYVTLAVRVPDEEVTVVGLRDLIKQSALNIAINALEAMPDGGTLGMSLERDAEIARVRISDTGPGIPAELRDRIFDMHFTTKGSGTGIGLYVARSMFEAQGGTVGVVSGEDGGATFELALPLSGHGS